MKRIIVLSLSLLLAFGAIQAQNKSAQKSKSVNPTQTSAAYDPNAMAPKVIKLNPEHVEMDMPLQEALNARASHRDMGPERLSYEQISSLLWCAYGFNRPEQNRRVVPSARNVQEFDIFLFNEDGIYQYDAKENQLLLVTAGDFRQAISNQKHFAVAPVSLVIVANYDRLKDFKAEADRDFFAAIDCGYISQNIYLYCASAHLGTVACAGIDREGLAKLLKVQNGKVLLAHPVGRY